MSSKSRHNTYPAAVISTWAYRLNFSYCRLLSMTRSSFIPGPQRMASRLLTHALLTLCPMRCPIGSLSSSCRSAATRWPCGGSRLTRSGSPGAQGEM